MLSLGFYEKGSNFNSCVLFFVFCFLFFFTYATRMAQSHTMQYDEYVFSETCI